MRVFSACVLVFAVFVPVAYSQDAVPLGQAIKEGKVEAVITGMGHSTGDAILITVRRNVSGVLRLTLRPGTVFRSVSGTVQNMAAASIKGERVNENSYRPETDIVLADNGQHSYLIEAYCLDFDKANPGRSDTFRLSGVDEQAARLLGEGKGKSASISAIQAALWMVRGGLSPAQIQSRFSVTPAEIDVARSILRDFLQKTSPAKSPVVEGGDAGMPLQTIASSPGPRVVAGTPKDARAFEAPIGSGGERVSGVAGGTAQDDSVADTPARVGNRRAIDDQATPQTRGVASDGLPAMRGANDNRDGQRELARRVVILENQVAELQRANRELVDIVNNHSTILRDIVTNRKTPSGGTYYVPNVAAISDDPKSRHTLVDTVVKDTTRSTGTLAIHNNTDGGQSLVVNGVAIVDVPAHGSQRVTVPSGTATTELVGAGEGVRSWAVGPPNYVQDVILAPASSGAVGVVGDWHYDPLTRSWWRKLP